MKIGRGVSELWGVENRPLPLTWPMAYTTACTTVQAVIHQESSNSQTSKRWQRNNTRKKQGQVYMITDICSSVLMLISSFVCHYSVYCSLFYTPFCPRQINVCTIVFKLKSSTVGDKCLPACRKIMFLVTPLVPNLGDNYPNWVLGPLDLSNERFFFYKCFNHNFNEHKLTRENRYHRHIN